MAGTEEFKAKASRVSVQQFGEYCGSGWLRLRRCFYLARLAQLGWCRLRVLYHYCPLSLLTMDVSSESVNCSNTVRTCGDYFLTQAEDEKPSRPEITSGPESHAAFLARHLLHIAQVWAMRATPQARQRLNVLPYHDYSV